MKNRIARAALWSIPVVLIALGGAIWAAASDDPPRALADPIAAVRRLLDQGKSAEARQICMSILHDKPDCVDAHRGLAWCARDEGDDEAFLRHLREWARLDPKNPVPWRQIALTAHRLGRTYEALSAAQTAASLTPGGDAAMSALISKLVMPEKRSPAARNDGLGLPAPQRPDPTKFLPKPGRMP